MKGKFSLIWRVVIALVLVLSFSLVAAVPATAATTDMPNAIEDAIGITNATGTTLESTAAAANIYIWVHDQGQDTWSLDPWTQESLTVTLKIYRGDGSRLVATKSYSAIEMTVNSPEFRTAAIPVSGLGVEPGYRLVASVTGGAKKSALYPVGGAVADDGGAQTDETTEANDAAANDMTLLPATPAVPDAYYFGYAKKFDTLWLNIGTQGAGVWTITWEYYDGSTWTALAGVTDNTSGFTAAVGEHSVSFTEPTDWATTAVSGITVYWIRGRVSAYTSITTQPKGTQAWIVGPNYIRAEVEFVEAGPYDVDGTMTLRVKDDSLNTVSTTKQNANVTPVTAATIDILGNSVTSIKANLVETGNDTGVFEYKTTPRLADNTGTKIWCGDAMEFIYEHVETTLGAPAPNTNQVKKVAYVSPTSASKVSFVPATVDPTAASVDVWVVDRNQSPTTALGVDTIASAVVVESLAADDSVIDSYTVPTLTENTSAGQFKATVNFGVGVNQLDITGAAKLQATYTDPADPSDVSTATAAIGTTVDLYDATGALHSSYTTIQAAINAAPAPATGWTVKVSEAYNSANETFPINVNKVGLTVESVGGAASTTIDAESAAYAIRITGDDVTVDGFTVVGGDVAFVALIRIQGANGVTVINNIITSVEYGVGISFHNSVADVGIANATVSGNQLDHCTMYLDSAGGTAITNSTISGNVITDGAITLEDNVIDITVSGNIISQCGDTGAIQIYAGTPGQTRDDILISGNTLSNNVQSGIWIHTGSTPTKLRIVGNDIAGNGKSGILIEDWTAASDAVIFNNIFGNTDYAVKNTSAAIANATHNWWGTATGPLASDISGLVTTTYYLTAPVKLTASYEGPAVAQTNFNFKVATGVKASASSAIGYAGAAEYTESPKAALADASFYDVFIDPTLGAADTVTVSFYTEGLTADSVAYFWNELNGAWEECSNQGYNSYEQYIWVLAKDQTVTVPTYPTIQELTGSMFAISTEEAPPEFDPWDYDIDEDGVMEIGEVLTAISAYFDGDITIIQVLEVITLYF